MKLSVLGSGKADLPLECASSSSRINCESFKNLLQTHPPDQMDNSGTSEREIAGVSQRYERHLYWGSNLLQVPLNGSTVPAQSG